MMAFEESAAACRPALHLFFRIAILALAVLALASPALAAPDLIATKTNDMSGVVTLGDSFTWSVKVENIGPDALVTSGVVPLVADSLPTANISYGAASITASSGLTGSPDCSIVAATTTMACLAFSPVTLTAGGSFTVSFSATPTAAGSYVNPRSGGVCLADPSGAIAEASPNGENNNTCGDTVTVTTGASGPDLTVVKNNDVGGATELAAGAFTWTLQVSNGGTGAATFASGAAILTDNLPSSGISYGAAAVSGQTGISGTGTISCSVASSNLSCSASGGTVILAAGTGSFTVSVAGTPSASGTFANPRSGGVCAVDPAGAIAEGDETNNACSDSISVSNSPDLIGTKTNDTGGAAIVGDTFTWSIKVDNIGAGSFTMPQSFPFLVDSLPDSNISYGTPTITGPSGISGTGTISCSIASTNLSCVASGGSVTMAGTTGTFTVNVAATPSAPGSFANPRSGGSCTVDTAAQDLELNEGNNSCADTVTVTTGIAGPDLTVAKNNDVGGTTEVPEGAFEWSFDVANGGDQDATFLLGEVILRDGLPNLNISYGPPAITSSVGISGTGAVDCSIETFTLTCTASGGTVTLAAETGAFTVDVAATPSASGTYVNPRGGQVCAVDPDGSITEGDETNNACSDAVLVNDSPDLIATKTNDTSGVGSTGVAFTWSIEVENIGAAAFAVPSASLILADSLPDSNMTYGTPSLSASSGLTGTLNCSVSGASSLSCFTTSAVTLAPGGSFTISLSATPSAVGTFANPRSAGLCRADVTNGDLETNESNNDCSDTVEVPSFAALSLTKTDSPDAVTAGEALTYILAASNAGPDTASAVAVYEVLPEGTTFDSVASDGSCSQPAGLVGLRAALDGASTTPPSGSAATGIASLVLDTGTNELRFAVTVSGITGSIIGASLRLTAGTLVHSLFDGAPPTFDDGTPIAGTIQLSQGEADALQVAGSHGIRVDTDGEPAGEIAGTVILAVQAPVVCDLGTIAASGSGSVQVVVNVGSNQADEVLENLAFVDASTKDPDEVLLPAGSLRGAAAAAATTVIASADLAILKLDSVDPVLGATFEYTLQVTNAGPSDARNVVATDPLPTGLLFDSSSDPCTEDTGTVTCSFGTVAAGAMVSRSFVVALAPSPPSTVVNTATVASDDPDPSSTNNTDDELTTLDADAPAVAVLGSVGDTGDGQLTDCETATVEIQQLLVTLSEAMFDPPGDSDINDVTNPDNYELITAGADRTFQTTLCGGPAGDDSSVSAASPAYAAGTRTATLDYGAPLADDLYRLLVCDEVQDLAGNSLDGDDDGTAGGDFVRSFRIDAGNLLANGHFDCDLGGWTLQSTNPAEITWVVDDYEASGDSGSAAVVNLTASLDFEVRQCADLALPDFDHLLEARFRLAAAKGASLDLARSCTFFDDLACAGTDLGTTTDSGPAVDTAGSWLTLSTQMVPPAQAISAFCSFAFNAPTGDDFDARLDFLSLALERTPLFVDGFESGDSSAWTRIVGGP